MGPFVPEVVLEHPEAVKGLHREFLRCGSDVMLAFTYYGHRAKLRLIGKEHLLESLQREALKLAHEVAAEASPKALVAGNICNSTVFKKGDASSAKQVEAMFDEVCGWAVEGGVDFIVGETYAYLEEALIATESIKRTGLPSVITLAVPQEGNMQDGANFIDACRQLKEAGATIVGLNCFRGPGTTLPLMQELVDAGVPGPFAALPVGWHTDEARPTFQCLSSKEVMYRDLDPHVCTRYEFEDFAKDCLRMGVHYIGTCCGAGPHHVRAIAEALGRHPPASEKGPRMDLHMAYGDPEAVSARMGDMGGVGADKSLMQGMGWSAKEN